MVGNDIIIYSICRCQECIFPRHRPSTQQKCPGFSSTPSSRLHLLTPSSHTPITLPLQHARKLINTTPLCDIIVHYGMYVDKLIGVVVGRVWFMVDTSIKVSTKSSIIEPGTSYFLRFQLFVLLLFAL